MSIKDIWERLSMSPDVRYLRDNGPPHNPVTHFEMRYIVNNIVLARCDIGLYEKAPRIYVIDMGYEDVPADFVYDTHAARAARDKRSEETMASEITTRIIEQG